ncbi:MAG: choice-of-anchor Q domain-containing protein [Pirellulales bacterium]
MLTVDAGQNSRIFNINASLGDFTISGLTLTGGQTTGSGVDFDDMSYHGGAVRSLTTGTLNFEDVVLTGNGTTGDRASGGAVFTVGDVVFGDSLISDNSTLGANSWGGAIHARNEGNVTLVDSIATGNSTSGNSTSGGAIWCANDVTLLGSSVTDNSVAGDLSGGGGVWAGQDVTLTDSVVSGNHVDGTLGGGGGISATGEVTLVHSAVSGNYTLGTSSSGGGIRAIDEVTLYDSTVSGNSTQGDRAAGGGIYSRIDVALHRSTVSGNSTSGEAAVGGGIYARDDLLVDQSTVSGNSTTGLEAHGAGLYARGDVTISMGTIADNHAYNATALGGGLFFTDDPATIAGSIVADNSAAGGGGDIAAGTGALHVDYSLIGADPGGIVGGNNLFGAPLLGPLAFNGGPTQTHAPLPGSPAIDAGDPAVAFNANEFDQRGLPFVRVVDGGAGGLRIDMGAFERQNLAGTLVVDTTADESDGDFSAGDLSLREAVELANGTDVDTITFDPLLFSTEQTIKLELGEIQIGGAVTIDGPDAKLLTVDAQQNSRIFNIVGHGDTTLRGMMLTGGRTSGDNAAGFDENYSGGAVRFYAIGTLTIEQCLVIGNNTPGARARGGAISSISQLQIIDSTISDNGTLGAAAAGGGVAANNVGRLTIIRSTISGNSTAGNFAKGGGVYSVNGSLTITQSTISGNQTSGNYADGGGVSRSTLGALTITDSTISENRTTGNYAIGGGISHKSSSPLTITQSTISRNSTTGTAAHGGGVYTSASPTIARTTIAENRTTGSSSQGGGIFASSPSDSLTFTMVNSIVAGNNAAASNRDVFLESDGVFDVDYSIIGTTSGLGGGQVVTILAGSGNLINTNPLLGPLADNGGPTQTHALLYGSPAIDAGDPSIAAAPDEFDQRGAPFRRVFDSGGGQRIDMGAYELLTGDGNLDGQVDGLDYLLWAQFYGDNPAQNPPGSPQNGDFNNDGMVDGLDYLIWAEMFGEGTAALPASQPASADAQIAAVDVALADDGGTLTATVDMLPWHNWQVRRAYESLAAKLKDERTHRD